MTLGLNSYFNGKAHKCVEIWLFRLIITFSLIFINSKVNRELSFCPNQNIKGVLVNSLNDKQQCNLSIGGDFYVGSNITSTVYNNNDYFDDKTGDWVIEKDGIIDWDKRRVNLGTYDADKGLLTLSEKWGGGVLPKDVVNAFFKDYFKNHEDISSWAEPLQEAYIMMSLNSLRTSFDDFITDYRKSAERQMVEGGSIGGALHLRNYLANSGDKESLVATYNRISAGQNIASTIANTANITLENMPGFGTLLLSGENAFGEEYGGLERTLGIGGSLLGGLAGGLGKYSSKAGGKIFDDVVGLVDGGARVLPNEVKTLATQNIKDSGLTVIGSYKPLPGKLNYIDKAETRVASYFDVGSKWDDLVGKGLDWEANKHFLDVISAKGDDVLLSLPKTEVNPNSILAKEIQYLINQKGYKWVNQWKLVPSK